MSKPAVAVEMQGPEKTQSQLTYRALVKAVFEASRMMEDGDEGFNIPLDSEYYHKHMARVIPEWWKTWIPNRHPTVASMGWAVHPHLTLD